MTTIRKRRRRVATGRPAGGFGYRGGYGYGGLWNYGDRESEEDQEPFGGLGVLGDQFGGDGDGGDGGGGE